MPYARLQSLFATMFNVSISQGTLADIVREMLEFSELKKGIIKCRDHIFNFLENPATPSDNNGSERGIRKLKVEQKISGCFLSDTGADAFHAIHSIVDTAWKNEQSPLNAILALV